MTKRGDASQEGRLRVIAKTLAPIALVFGLVNLGLTVILGPAPEPLNYSELVDPYTRETIAARVATVERMWQDPRTRSPRLAVVLGLSTAREGIDPFQIHQAAHEGLRLLNIAASGGSFREMRRYAEPLLDSELKPDTVVLAVHPSWLAGRQLHPAPVGSPIVRGGDGEVSTSGKIQQLKRWVIQSAWVLDNRPGIHSEIRRVMQTWRAHLRRWINMPPAGPAQEGDDYPWTVQVAYQDQHASPEFLESQLREWASAGWFDPGRFGVQTAEAQVLRSLLEDARGKARNLVVVLMPEADAFRREVPPRAAETLIDIVHEVDMRIPILDLRASLPAEMFRDQAHLNAGGRRVLTQEIAVRVLGISEALSAESSGSRAGPR